jgi:hypothetical protein
MVLQSEIILGNIIDLQLTCHGTTRLDTLPPVLQYASWAQSSITYLNRRPPTLQHHSQGTQPKQTLNPLVHSFHPSCLSLTGTGSCSRSEHSCQCHCRRATARL